MRVGLYYFLQAVPGRPNPQIFFDELEQMVLAEELGYDSVWLTEHHFSDYGLSSAPSVLLSHVAARTRRIQLGLAVYVIPFHHPLRLAEETATLDVLSRGRLTVGIGRGNRPLEFVGNGVDQEESRSRMQEGVSVLLQAWTQERVTFHGRHWNFDNIPVVPKPLTQPHPPLALAAGSPRTLTWAAQQDYALLTSGLFTPLSGVLSQRARYESALVDSGRSPERVAELLRRWVVTKHVYVAPTDAEAQADAEQPERWYLDAFVRSIRPDGLDVSPSVVREASETVERMSQLTWEGLLTDSLIVGSPSTVRRKVEALCNAGVGELACWMNFGGIPHAKAIRSMRLFAEEVLPAVHARVEVGALR
jgi:alkanesulfonate monooxygenase SsuD/methylene tetrahydromethanopterin reductase-like flavin-dependent oxidoreductase (luciferase family)